MEQCTFDVRLTPRARHEAVRFFAPDGPLLVAVSDPPLDNRANERCIAVVAKTLGVPKSALRIIRGAHSRNKVIGCTALTRDAAIRRLVDSCKEG